MTDWQDALFTPRRVAVAGASASPGKAGALVLRNLTAVEAGFAGEVIAIHPSASEILGCPAYPSFGAVPAPVDLAIIVTPPAAVPEAIDSCGAAGGVPVAIVISGGFAEVGPRGIELQREVARIAAAHGVRSIDLSLILMQDGIEAAPRLDTLKKLHGGGVTIPRDLFT